jgi:putative addiction module component (TIGR02574 family)
MARTLDEIREEAMQLEGEERGALADSLWESFLTAEEREVEEAWLDEAERRLADYEAGRAEAIPYDDVMRELRAKLSATSRVSHRR